jgi:glycosyltransferase involved in cell wall biosynthesis
MASTTTAAIAQPSTASVARSTSSGRLSRTGEPPFRIAIDVRALPGVSGGIAQAVGSLVHALGQLTDGAERYVIVADSPKQMDWLEPLVGPNQQLVLRPESKKDRWLRALKPAIRFVQKQFTLPRYWPEVQVSDGFYESLGCDLIHFPTQNFRLCALPAVYNPIDLQHLHHPQFFTPGEIAARETIYRTGCQIARALIVNSTWIKNDIVRQYRVDPDKVHVVAEAPSTASSAEPSKELLASLLPKYGLDSDFVLYPAVTWPHKNHLRTFEALACLRDERGKRLQLVCTGSRYEPFWPAVQDAIRRLSLESQVRFLGHVPQEDLRGLYRLAGCLVLPSLFEANSLPIFEAWLEGTAVACANATGLPEQVEDAAALFDPHDALSIADALESVVFDAARRDVLRARGRRRLQQFGWDKTAGAYRAIYRGVAGRRATHEDLMIRSPKQRATEAHV